MAHLRCLALVLLTMLCLASESKRELPAMLPPAITRFGPVQVISIGAQPKKVWKHCHDPDEHWERLAGQDLTRFRAEADEVVRVRRYDHLKLPALSGEAKLRAHRVLCRHHDDYYGPIYLAELSSSET